MIPTKKTIIPFLSERVSFERKSIEIAEDDIESIL